MTKRHTTPSHPPLPTLAEGTGWLVVAKPPRVLTHRNPLAPRQPAALQIVRDMVGRHVYPIHRLDCAASGCLLFATEKSLAGPLSAAFSGATKVYLALVRGDYRAEGDVVVDNPMKDDNGIWKDARSVVRRLGSTPDPRSSLLRVVPETGRYHQVRRHVRDLHHPILGDHNHGDTRVNRWWREERGLPRLGLHSLSLAIPKRANGFENSLSLTVPWEEPIEVVCPLFEDMAAVLRALPFWDEAAAREPALLLPTLPVAPEYQSNAVKGDMPD